MTQDMNHTLGKALRAVFVAAMMSLTGSHALAEDTQSSTGTGVHVMGNVFGGGNLAEVKGRVTVNIKAGTVVNDVYGGGAKANTNSSINTITQEDGKDVYPTTVNLTGGTIGNAYGGGLGEKEGVNGGTEDKEALVYGDVLVNVNGTAFTQEFDTYTVGSGEDETTVQVPRTGRVFGCNNLNGSPKKTVTVHVYQTVPVGGGDHQTGVYEIAAVYGGGNEAAYEPTISGTETDANHAHTNVIVDGCSLTSIKQVYGGGNAASTPSTQVTINGAFEIDEVFGGGNGNDMIKRTSGSDVSWEVNSGANVGFYAYDADSEDYDTPEERAAMAYGFGKAKVNINGGIIHYVYGGSNAKGNVRQVAVAMLEKTSDEDCFTVDEAYGGGKAAPMDGKAELQLGCIPGVGTVYGGARAATVNNDVVLTITNGTYNNVFGGNNEKGTINGSITINVEETGCRPIHIGNLYGGGNLAPYTTPSGKNGPTINIKSFTSIDHVYGGGFGAGANVTGDVTVNINEVKGRWSQANTTVESNTYNETGAATIGVIGDVYGGGYGADVIGNVEVNIGTEEKIEFVTTVTNLTPDSEGKYTVEGANITGSVYGGGYGAETTVTGNVDVNIGGQKTEGTTTTFIGGNIAIGGSVYGGSALGAVNATTTKDATTGNITAYTPTEGATTTVTLMKGEVSRYVFGGGQGNDNTTAHVFGPTTVTLYGDVVAGGLYGGCDANGEMHNGTQLDLFGGTVGQSSAPTADILFGGGLGQATTVDGNVTVNVGSKDYTGSTSVTIWGNVYGGGALGDVNMPKNSTDATVYTTLVNLYKGTVHGNVFGGGLGQAAKAAVAAEYKAVENGTTLTSGKTYYTSAEGAGEFVAQGDEVANESNYFEMTKEPAEAVSEVAAEVKGNVRVDLNGYDGIVTDVSDNENYNANAFGSCIVTGNIFGCNNTKGSPKGDVEVHIYKTIGTGTNVRSNDKDNTTFDLTSVFGGGNKATYSASDKTAKVIIETCDVSIEEVYGGGYGADVPNTQVEVKGAYEIGTVFGGGYGAGSDDPTAADYNPGANVSGSTDVILKGGVVHEVYGGSNTKGNIVVGSNVNVSDGSGCCDLKVDNIYGGGKNASMEGGTSIVLGCQPNTWIEDIYAGSREADVNGNVKLTITSGKFKRVFGGNKTSGKLKGSITVNIEETGTCNTPIIIGELYAGGNEADYSIYGYKDNGDPMTADDLRTKLITDNPGMTTEEIDALFQTTKKANPQLNVLAFTSIGAVYGGGYSAKMYADPTVSINVVKGSHYNDDALAAGSTPALAGVTPATTLPYPAHAKGAIGAIGNVFGGGNLANVYGSTTVNIGTETTVGFVTEPVHLRTDPETPLSKTNGLYVVPVEGAIITGNVYGGGNQANVTGDTQVNICVKKNDSNVYENVAPGTAGVSIGGDVFGAGKGVNTDVEAALVEGNGIVKMGGGSVAESVYGGGELSQVGGDTDVTVSGGTIGTTGLGGATHGNIYGGGFGSTDDVRFGLVKGDTYVTVTNVVADATYAAAHDGVNDGDVISTPTVIHNIYGGGAYGSVGTFTYASDAVDAKITGRTSGGTTHVTVSGGTIGTTGQNNGMVFGSSRGDVGAPDAIHDRLAWVYDTHVTIGSSGQGTTTPTINGSIYGGGENGHNYHNADVYIYSGTIGIHDDSDADATRGNVYGGGCGTDKYYTGTIPDGHTANDGEGNKYNPLAGIVYGDATITMAGGLVKHNIYGAGAMGSVGLIEKNATTNAITIASGGTTTIAVNGGIVGHDGNDNGNVFGAARGDKAFTDRGLALVKETSVTISGTTTQIKGNVYGGGEVGNVQADTRVNIQGGAIAKNVFGGGKGVEDLFTCEQAMVGVDGEGAGANLDTDVNNKGTIVTITNGTVGTLNEGALVEGTGNVYGGGEIGRVEWNAQVIIGSATGTSTPVIHGNVFGAGKGLETHGYSALVRGNSTVTVQGGAKVGHCVYGGGENSTVGRYWVKGINNSAAGAPDAPEDLPDGMPYQQQSGGICRVTIQGNAVIGGDNNADLYTGHVFGAGRGVVPHFNAGTTDRMVNDGNGGSLVAFANKTDATTGEVVKTAEELYLEFLQTLSLATNAYVTIDGSAHVKGSVFGGSESGFVQTNTDVRILNGTIGTTASYGNVFGGGRGLEAFAEAGKVKGTTKVTISGGTAYGNVYGGGNLGDVGIITKNTTDYNYTWNQSDGVTVNAHYNNTITGTNTNTGICKVTIAGGTIGVETTAEPTKHGNVFGAGRGLADTWWCEKAIAYATNVTVNKGTVYGNVYGGGEVGRVEDDAKVTIGALNGTDVFEIKGSVFGAGAGLKTHGYSALVRGNAEVTVQGKAQVGGSVYGGGEIASVGRFHVVGGLPRNPQAGGTCTVKIQGEAKIGTSGTTGHNVFGACKGVTPTYDNTQGSTDRSKSMQLAANRPAERDPETGVVISYKAEDTYWNWYVDDNGHEDRNFVWVYYQSEPEYLDFLKTLALTSNTHVTVGGSSNVYGSVFGGGERGITLGGVDVNMTGGTVHEDVYGGGSLADSNTAMWDAANETLHDYAVLELIPGLSHVTGYYKGENHELVTNPNAVAGEGEANSYSAIYKTNVNLTGGTIKGNAYGGGLGRKEYGTSGQTGYVSPIAAMVYGDVLVELNNNNSSGPADGSKTGCAVNRVFGCNNLNGTPKGKVKVHVYATQKDAAGAKISDKTSGSYDVDAVYGGGNLSPYIPVDAYSDDETILNAARPQVIIDGCELTSIRQVYGGGNAASVPATFVEINGTYEIDEVFGGGNGADNYSLKEGNATVWYQNPGANVGYFDYTNTVASGTSPGTVTNPYYLAVDKEEFDTKAKRLPDPDTEAAAKLRYGSGIARLEVYGGTIHTSYGGSNSRGNVRTSLSSVYSANGGCTMSVGRSYGSGKNAESDGEVDMVADCAHGIKEMFGGSENADVENNINLRITNGSSLERVFGGNNTSGAVNGSITVTIEEGGCEPIKIGHLYLGGFLAPYSVYGYEKNADGSYKTEPVKYIDAKGVEQTLDQRIPLESGNERKADPCLYVISATRIDSIFGGGYQAKLVGNPRVNINMKQGKVLLTRTGSEGSYVYKDAMGTEYTENITPETTGEGASAVTKYYATLPLGTIGTVYGGGNMADVVGDTYVEIGTGKCVTSWDDDGKAVYTPVTPARNGANITGNVFGGGKGVAAESGEGAFFCAKAMVGKEDDGLDADGNLKPGGTSIIIGNGTVAGNVYGGGEIGRVERNTAVTIGLAADDVPAGLTSKPEIKGNVFGAGKGMRTHGYSALVRGNTTVIIQGDAKVDSCVYGGGEIASVGRYNVKKGPNNPEGAPDDVLVGMPYSLKASKSGKCVVIVKDNAEIGPDGMMMNNTTTGKPDDSGHVFGAGKGVLPYEGYAANETPWRMPPSNVKETFDETTFSVAYYTEKYGADYDRNKHNYMVEYLQYIESLALATQTEVTISGNAFVKGSVYGGSMNGHVQHDTHVTIEGDCQIGQGEGITKRYKDHYGAWPTETEDITTSWKECAHWDYVANDGAPYDPYATKLIDGKYYYDEKDAEGNYIFAEGGSYIGKDGHTYYGNVFGGGSGVIPYAPGKWHRGAGSVGGNTRVDITGGHILTSVYGGNEQTDVGTYVKDDNGQPTTTPVSDGKCTISMTGGTIGVPRTKEDTKRLPVNSYLFGAGKGDPRIFFNTWTNVIETEVNISGDARIYGSTFGGGEDGHVINDAKTNISGDAIIGSTGTSYVDGNVFGGGRGFTGDAQTAGTVGGNVELKISNGKILGSVYGGGRLASVGTMFEFPTLDDGKPNPAYGNFKEDGNGKTYGHVAINISGGTIGNTKGNIESGNVFGGSMGRLELLNGTRNPIWPKMAQVKSATVNISGDNTVIRRSVYGGGELGTVRDDAEVTISGGTVRRDVYGGGYGSEDMKYTVFSVKEPNGTNGYVDNTYAYTPMQFAGCVGKSTTVNISGGYIRKSVYGGGEMASVGVIDYSAAELTSGTSTDGKVVFRDAASNKEYYYTNMVKHDDVNKGFALSWPYEFEYVPGYNGATHVNITGGRLGLKDSDEDNTDIKADNGDVYGAGKGKAGDYKDYLFCANVGSTDVKIAYTTTPEAYSSDGDLIAGAVYGGGEDGHVMGDTKLTMSGGLVYHSLYGAGSGKGKFPATLKKIGKEETYDTNIYSITAGKVFGNSTVEMSGGYVVRNVYGGGNMGSVGKGNYAGGDDDYSTTGYGEKVDGNLWDDNNKFSTAFLNSGKCTVNITGGTIGYIDSSEPSNSMYPWNSTASLPYGNVFGGCRGESAPNILETPRYLYSPEFFVGYANETEVTIGGDTKILGSVYGGGMDGHIRRDTHVIINGGEIGLPFTEANQNNVVKTSDPNHIQWLARGNVYGAGSGIGQYKYDFDYDGKYTSTVTYNGKQTKEEDFSTSAGSVTRFTTVTINGGKIYHNVYGGGSLSSIGAPKIPVDDVVPPDPYLPTDPQHSSEVGKQSLNHVTIAGGEIGNADDFAKGYGGNVFGASRGDATIADPSSFATSVWTDVDVTGGTIAGDVYGGGEVGTVRQSTDIDLTGGIISHDVFGGGKGTSSVAADVGGDASVDLNNVAADTKGCVVKGSVYGANNINGTPKGHVLVHVFGTQNENTGTINAKVDGKYDVTAVFGGGKSADYVPTDTKQTTEVIIEGCDLTSIQEVYGGGYGAAVPATNVLVKGTKIINNVFGGGYGAGEGNPGANVGFLTGGARYASGSGQAVVQLMAGTVHNVYGGSNTKGDILNGSSVTNVANDNSPGCCDKLSVQEIYGGGSQADMFGGTEIVLGCMPDDWIGAIYAGAENANVGNDVSLTLTSGKFGRVFGGNKSGGTIDGYIEVNIEENPECSTPIIIGGLYGGGNEAPYTVPARYFTNNPNYQSPRVNVRAFTSIGNIYGGGFGASATVTGNPLVNVNEVQGGREYAGEEKSLEDGTTVKLYARKADGKMGVIGNVFGGGNAAKVIGNTNVMIGTEAEQEMESLRTTDATTGTVTVVKKPVVGADIRGNVYGGGNAAEVTGKTNVVIGKKAAE